MSEPEKAERIAPEKPERIAKVIARAGLCSRRDAERLVAEGRVAVDGQVIETPATTVLTENRVTVDGEALPALEPGGSFLRRVANSLSLTSITQPFQSPASASDSARGSARTGC